MRKKVKQRAKKQRERRTFGGVTGWRWVLGGRSCIEETYGNVWKQLSRANKRIRGILSFVMGKEFLTSSKSRSIRCMQLVKKTKISR